MFLFLRDGGHADHNPPAVLTSSGKRRAEDARDLLEKVENLVCAPSGEVEEQERLLGVWREDYVSQVFPLEDCLGPVDSDLDTAAMVNL